MAYNYRGRRVAYDNIAVGAATGPERTLPESTSDHTRYDGTSVSDPSLYSPDGVSVQGSALETGTISNIAIGSSGGIEDTDNDTADKLTTDSETVDTSNQS